MRNSEKRTWGIRILFLIGFLLCCIPLLSGVIEKRRQAEAVATYQEAAEKETASFEELYRKAEEYNDMLYQSGGAMVDGMTEDLLSEESYQKQLALSETGIMGSLEIPKINVNLPIYHGTGEEALANGVGHLEGSSLPIGGRRSFVDRDLYALRVKHPPADRHGKTGGISGSRVSGNRGSGSLRTGTVSYLHPICVPCDCHRSVYQGKETEV